MRLTLEIELRDTYFKTPRKDIRVRNKHKLDALLQTVTEAIKSWSSVSIDIEGGANDLKGEEIARYRVLGD